MQEAKAFNEKRAEIYWWLSSLFARELTEDELTAYHTAEIRGFISGLGENPQLTEATSALINSLNQLQDRADVQLELSADFCGLFLATAKNAALPYASLYIGTEGLLNGKPALAMEQLMKDKDITKQEGFNEPADHLALELDFLGNLIVRSNEIDNENDFELALLEQKQFIEQHMLTWVPSFNAKCRQFDEFGFYAAVAQLLLAFLKLDCEYISGEQ